MCMLERIDIQDQRTYCCLQKVESNNLYNAYLNESPFKYYISILGGLEVGVGIRPCLSFWENLLI